MRGWGIHSADVDEAQIGISNIAATDLAKLGQVISGYRSGTGGGALVIIFVQASESGVSAPRGPELRTHHGANYSVSVSVC